MTLDWRIKLTCTLVLLLIVLAGLSRLERISAVELHENIHANTLVYAGCLNTTVFLPDTLFSDLTAHAGCLVWDHNLSRAEWTALLELAAHTDISYGEQVTSISNWYVQSVFLLTCGYALIFSFGGRFLDEPKKRGKDR